MLAIVEPHVGVVKDDTMKDCTPLPKALYASSDQTRVSPENMAWCGSMMRWHTYAVGERVQ